MNIFNMQTKYNSKYSGTKELINVELMKNYNFNIVKNAFEKIDNKFSRIIDFGAGIGTLSLIFRDEFDIDPICIEIDKGNIEFLKERKLLCIENLKSISDEVDFIFSSNVLEHIKNDSYILKEFWKQLKIGGKIYLYLPAKMILWSSLDESVGHYRRYEISSLRSKLRALGFNILEIHYADCLGFFVTLFWKFLNKKSEHNFASKKSLIFYDKYIFPISNFLDKLGLRFLFGKNIVLTAEKL